MASPTIAQVIPDQSLPQNSIAGIVIRTNQFRLQDSAQIATATTSTGKGGDIDLVATQSITLRGLGAELFQQQGMSLLYGGTLDLTSPLIALNASTLGTGRGGNVSIAADQIWFENGTGLGSTTTQSAQAGTLKIRAREVSLDHSALFSGSLRGSTGAAGDMEIQADRLTVRDGAVVISSTFGAGNSGNMTFKIRELITLEGAPRGSISQILIASNSLGDNQARAGDITIETGRFAIANGAGISSSTSTSGFVGQFNVSRTGGQGGDLTIQATESIDLFGISKVLENGTQIPSYLATETSTSSPGGNIQLTAPVVSIHQGGLISTGSLSLNRAGNITINAGRLEIARQTQGFTSGIEAAAGKLLLSGFTDPSGTADAGNLNFNVRDP